MDPQVAVYVLENWRTKQQSKDEGWKLTVVASVSALEGTRNRRPTSKGHGEGAAPTREHVALLLHPGFKPFGVFLPHFAGLCVSHSQMHPELHYSARQFLLKLS